MLTQAEQDHFMKFYKSTSNDGFDILITAQAEADLDKIIEFIRQQWSDSIKTDFLAAFPKRCSC